MLLLEMTDDAPREADGAHTETSYSHERELRGSVALDETI